MFTQSLLALTALVAPITALSGLATTTRYFDGQEGACGCGSSSGLFSWQTGIGNDVFTAAGSQALFASSGSSWCGSGCGTCYELTSTGSAPAGQGAGGDKGQSIIVMVTNLCPNAGNAQWCPNPGQKNSFGYEYHFDIMAANSGLPEILGDNPVVNFTSVACPGQAKSDFAQCVCASSRGGAAGSGTSDAGSSSGAASPAPVASPGAENAGGSAEGGSAAGTAAHWAQCGGEGFSGPTECASGFTCQVQNPWYSQCL